MKISFSNTVCLIIALIFAGFIASCKGDKNKYSNIPFLQINEANIFNNGNGKDSFILVSLYFTDGDGDIGLNPGDSASPFGYGEEYFYNLKIWMLEMKGGKWIKPLNPLSNPVDTLNFHERLLPITPTGHSKWVEGHLDLTIPAEPYSLKPDTIKLQAQLFDRALHKSALIESAVLILKH